MLHHRHSHPRSRDGQRTPRRRILALVVGAGGILAVLITGLVLSIAAALGAGSKDEASDTTGRPTIQVAQPSSFGAETPTTPPAARAPIVIPGSTTAGIHGVATGYPQTAEGAVAQLAAIDVAVLRASLDAAGDALRDWSHGNAQPGWSIEALINEVLQQRGHRPEVMPVMARIGRTATLNRFDVCVLLQVQDASERRQSPDRSAHSFAHCEAMVWNERRWLIAPGKAAQPQAVPQPGSAEAYKAGYRMFQGAAAPDQR
ncbi:hypothetical protein LWF15_24320 [Kineosporia rhizophila]|uniref:hypothetical protein n=1 Tax=Kineosporia rhizophila TaxID=84633 RepID=UPI001E496D7A|nr:hypothetical protein [Kineosporia rhizophila]MCE0538629.1 hypothetical protein [Kineosporia rhizophila]